MNRINILIIALVLLLVWAWYWVWSVGNISVAKADINIKSGTSFTDLAKTLHMDISDTRLRLYRKFFVKDFDLKSGTYKITAPTTFSQALAGPLKKPAYEDQTVMFLPGWSVFDIDPYLTNQWVISKGDLIRSKPSDFPKLVQKYPFLEWKKSFEGFIYPDTYRIKQKATLEDVLDKALSSFNGQIYGKIVNAEQKKKFYDTLILASIVEREERNSEAKPMIAGILTKRLQIGMSLGADATLCYALSFGFQDCTPSQIANALDNLSPYNTRKYSWLPPTPISNPTRETWLAAANPEKTDALFYLHDDQGNIHYADTNEEHNANRRKYLGN